MIDSEYEKFFDKDFFNPPFQTEDNNYNKNNESNNLTKNQNLPILSPKKLDAIKNNLSNSNKNILYNNIPHSYFLNPIFSQQINKNINNNSIYGRTSNGNMFSNANTSFTSNNENNNNIIFNPN